MLVLPPLDVPFILGSRSLFCGGGFSGTEAHSRDLAPVASSLTHFFESPSRTRFCPLDYGSLARCERFLEILPDHFPDRRLSIFPACRVEQHEVFLLAVSFPQVLELPLARRCAHAISTLFFVLLCWRPSRDAIEIANRAWPSHVRFIFGTICTIVHLSWCFSIQLSVPLFLCVFLYSRNPFPVRLYRVSVCARFDK